MASGEKMDWSVLNQSTNAQVPGSVLEENDGYRRSVANTMFGFFLIFGVGAVLLLVVVLWLIGMAFGVNPGL